MIELHHGTRESRVESILKEGLDPQQATYGRFSQELHTIHTWLYDNHFGLKAVDLGWRLAQESSYGTNVAAVDSFDFAALWARTHAGGELWIDLGHTLHKIQTAIPVLPQEHAVTIDALLDEVDARLAPSPPCVITFSIDTLPKGSNHPFHLPRAHSLLLDPNKLREYPSHVDSEVAKRLGVHKDFLTDIAWSRLHEQEISSMRNAVYSEGYVQVHEYMLPFHIPAQAIRSVSLV